MHPAPQRGQVSIRLLPVVSLRMAYGVWPMVRNGPYAISHTPYAGSAGGMGSGAVGRGQDGEREAGIRAAPAQLGREALQEGLADPRRCLPWEGAKRRLHRHLRAAEGQD